jgi:hypothetical protein
MPQFSGDIDSRLGGRFTIGWPWQFLLTMFIVFMAAVLVYLGLSFGYAPFLRREISSINSQLDKLNLEVTPEEQKSFVNFYSQIVNLEALLKSHKAVSKVFGFLEATTLKDVSLNSINISAAERTVSLEAAAKSYQALSGQMVLYENASETVERAALENSRLSGSTVQFKVNLTMRPEVFAM